MERRRVLYGYNEAYSWKAVNSGFLPGKPYEKYK
jgi:hypothetical protein